LNCCTIRGGHPIINRHPIYFLQRYDEAIGLTDIEKDGIIEMATIGLDNILDNSNISNWFEKELFEYNLNKNTNGINRTSFCNGTDSISLLENSHRDYYVNYVYRCRNRYAHNLTSYQLNIPTFSQLLKDELSLSNHFRMFSFLILLDGIFMKYFEKFLNIRYAHSY